MKKIGLLLWIGLLNIFINQYVAAGDDQSQLPIDENGKVIISGDSSDFVGIWVPVYFVDGMGPSFNFDDVQMKSWARGLYEDRQTHDLEPHARCKASGAVRQLLTPYGVEIVDIPELQRIYIFDIGGNKLRLIAICHFQYNKLYIREILSHSEYDKNKWKK